MSKQAAEEREVGTTSTTTAAAAAAAGGGGDGDVFVPTACLDNAPSASGGGGAGGGVSALTVAACLDSAPSTAAASTAPAVVVTVVAVGAGLWLFHDRSHRCRACCSLRLFSGEISRREATFGCVNFVLVLALALASALA